MFVEYIIIFKFFFFSLGLSLLLFLLSFLLVFQNPDFEKLSTYECGFNPWGDSRSKFEVRFYLVGILFIIFDLEITFLFPWVVSLSEISMLGIYVMVVFIVILTIVSYMNEWKELWSGNNMLYLSNIYSKRYFFLFFHFSIILYYYNLLFFIIGDFIEGFSLKRASIDLFINSLDLYLLLIFVKFNTLCKFFSLMDIVALDYPNRSAYRFELNYIFWSNYYNFSITIKLFGGSNFIINSVSSLFKSANWLEREVWDLFGVKFLFHPNLRRILTDYGFKGHPLRKDFPLVGFIELRYDDLYKSVFVEPVEMSQSLRLFSFNNPWGHWK